MIHVPLPIFFQGLPLLLFRSSILHCVVVSHVIAPIDEVCAFEELEDFVD